MRTKFPDRPVIYGRSATATEPINGRAPCHYCGHCGRVCNVSASFSSSGVLLPIAEKTGNLTLRPNAVAWKVLRNKEGKAKSVLFVDRQSRELQEAFGKVIILGAGCLESTRILLNSKDEENPNGITNSSGVLGKYFCEQIMGGSIMGVIPTLRGRKSLADDARPDGAGIYVPRFRNLKDKQSGYIRGFGFEGGGGSSEFPGFARKIPGFGAGFKEEVKKNNATIFSIGAFGEVLARPENYVEIDPVIRDAWGIPVLKFNIEWGPNELAMAKDIVATQREMFAAAGIEVMNERATSLPPGWSIHEAGTARMGDDPKKSVLNKFNQCHDVKNLYVVDASSFVSSTEKNPTLTILTLAMRASDHIAEEFRLGRLG
jgi:choline dehydrogenase-like flavoprotein